MVKVSKRFKEIDKSFDKTKLYNVLDASEIIKKNSNSKFDETVEIAINLGVDPRHSDQIVRGAVVMPNGIGKSIRVAVFAKDKKADEAKSLGAELVGGEDLAEKIQNGEEGFERVIATPDMMGIVGKLGKVLGPKGLMPNPKLRTVTQDIELAINAAKSGEVQFRAEKSGIVHAGIAKTSLDKEKIAENVNAFIKAIIKAKPAGAKGTYIKKISLSSTMGRGVKLEEIKE